MKFSKITLIFGAFIVISASFMQQIRGYFIQIFGQRVLLSAVMGLFFIISILFLFLTVKNSGLLKGSLKKYFLTRIPTNEKPNLHKFLSADRQDIRGNLIKIRVHSCQKEFPSAHLKILIVFLLLILTYFLIKAQPYLSEKTHIFSYGFLGFLATKDLCQKRRHPLLIICGMSILVFMVSCLDEVFQHILPYRVGELRDVITNFIAGLLGGGLYKTIR
jgi:VanZ family protein